MGLSQTFRDKLRVYVVRECYLQIHIYCAEEADIQEASQFLGVPYKEHKSVFGFIVTRRADIGRVSSKLLTLFPEHATLLLLLRYAEYESKEERQKIVDKFINFQRRNE